MGDILDMISRMNKRAGNDIFNTETEIKESVKCFKIFTDEIRKELLEAENNHNKPIFPNTPYKKGRSSKRLVETSSSDEEANVSSTKIQLHNTAPEETLENISTKPKRGAAKAASANIKKCSAIKLNSKMRRPSNEENTSSHAFDYTVNIVKTEKRSELSKIPEESTTKTALADVTNDNMPPPILKPKRGRKKVKKETEESDTSAEKVTRPTRSTRSRIKEQPTTRTRTTTTITTTTTTTTSSPHRKDSDVLIQEVPVAVVVITDSESELDKTPKIETEVKAKRGKKPPKKNKMTLKIKEEKEDKPVPEEPKNNTQNSVQEESVYEDALSENKTEEPVKNPGLNETHVLNKGEQLENSPAITDKIKETGVQLNCTVVLETMHAVENLNETKILPKKQHQPPLNNLLTDDDESFDAPPNVAAQTPNKKQAVKTKPIFSPYGNSPVKKRVAAFEKLGTADVPERVTRTKTRNHNQETQDTPLHKKAVPPPVGPSSKVKKNFTPSSNNKLPSMIPQSDNKYKSNKNISVASSEASVKCLTAVKASRAELQERREEEQKRKQEHENEVKRKKEALLQAKIEEQKRKREEKQLKAQKAREAKDREKEEKIRRIIAEKEEKLAKEEQMKREWMNQMAKKAAEDEKIQQMIKQEKIEQKRKLNKKPPPLPTDDLQDTDDEEENPKHKYVGPLWSQRQILYPALYAQRYIPPTITKEFFQMQAQTPNLLEIFETVNADILRRNSSAVWRTPPRYSTLPKF